VIEPRSTTEVSDAATVQATRRILGLTPQRVAKSSDVAGRVVIERPRPSGRGLEVWLRRVRYVWTAKRLRLDALGSSTWRLADGRLTVAEIAEALRGEFGETAEPAEERVARFLSHLHRDELLVFRELGD
jgi:hypothetical protein